MPKLKHKLRPTAPKRLLPMAIPQSQEQDDQFPEPPPPPPLLTRSQCEQWLRDPTTNPLTGRLIKIGGPVFGKLKHACSSYGIQIPEPKGTFGEMYHCSNDSDPVGGDQYAQMQEDDVKNLIRLGSGMCYPLDTIYNWYKTKRQSTEIGTDISVTDPMVPSYVLSDEEIGIINRYMRQQDENYIEPQGKISAVAPVGYRLEINQDWSFFYDFHNLMVIRPDGSVRNIGTLPMTIDEGGISSYVALQKIYDVWSKGLLMQSNNPEEATGLTILDMTAPGGISSAHWWDNGGTYYLDPLSVPGLRERIARNLEALNRELDLRLD